MGKITVVLPDDLENKFRELAIKRFGMKRGNLSDAALDAIKQYVTKG